MKLPCLLLLGFLPVAPAWAALPTEVTVTAPAQFELMQDGKARGTISLAPGAKLEVLDVSGNYVLVRYRNANGRVLMARTDIPPDALSDEPVRPVAPPKSAPKPAPAAAHPAAHAPATALERTLAGKLVRLEGGALRPCDGARLAGVKFYAIYFSASWCPPCREFTPGLVDAYGKIRELYPEFELVLVSRDRSAAEMEGYMRGDQMQWPALDWKAIRGADAINGYAGDGIPCLVLVDENGRVLSDSYRWGRYVGPDAVLDDIWKILRDYRRQNPHRKA